MRRRAFTLIEVLVVIAIVAVLAAIMTPVFLRAKLEGKKTACISNLHQIALARSIEDGRPAPAIYCPMADAGSDPSYYSSWDLSDEAHRAFEQAESSPAIMVCYRHGKRLAGLPGTEAAAFDGIVLRLKGDASVQKKDIRTMCYFDGNQEVQYRPSWLLYGDTPCPPQFCRTDLHACP